jgi:hypothetical protein
MVMVPDMTILTEKKKWQRKRSPFAAHRKERATLTPEQQANVRRALRHLLRRFHTRARLAAAMGMSLNGYEKARTPLRGQTPRLALIVARVAECSIDDILTAKWPPPVVCPRCKGVGHVPA